MSKTLTGVAAILEGSASKSSIFDLFSLTGHVALVTGGHSGLGLEAAVVFAEAGAIVYCLDIHPSPGDSWLKLQKHAEATGRLKYISGDVSNFQSVHSAVEAIVEKEGRIDVCLASAGVGSASDILDFSPEEIKKVLDVNLNGVLFTAQAAGKQMEKLKRQGSIILVASVLGMVGTVYPPTTIYSISKAAVIQMARSMACELGPKGIRVNSVSPGWAETPMTSVASSEIIEYWAKNPLGRIARPDELRGIMLYLASNASSFCTGSNICVDGGHSAW